MNYYSVEWPRKRQGWMGQERRGGGVRPFPPVHNPTDLLLASISLRALKNIFRKLPNNGRLWETISKLLSCNCHFPSPPTSLRFASLQLHRDKTTAMESDIEVPEYTNGVISYGSIVNRKCSNPQLL